jgi:hypothetical protein
MNGWAIIPVTDAHVYDINAVFDGPIQARYYVVKISSRVHASKGMKMSVYTTETKKPVSGGEDPVQRHFHPASGDGLFF